MRARLLLETKESAPNNGIIHIRIWQLPHPTAERPHGLKYSLFYGKPGERIIGYDNERGKGDHRHYRNHEEPYTFVDIQTLLIEFRRDVAKEMSHERDHLERENRR